MIRAPHPLSRAKCPPILSFYSLYVYSSHTLACEGGGGWPRISTETLVLYLCTILILHVTYYFFEPVYHLVLLLRLKVDGPTLSGWRRV